MKKMFSILGVMLIALVFAVIVGNPVLAGSLPENDGAVMQAESMDLVSEAVGVFDSLAINGVTLARYGMKSNDGESGGVLSACDGCHARGTESASLKQDTQYVDRYRRTMLAGVGIYAPPNRLTL